MDETFSHIGVVVADLEEGIERFGAALGLRFIAAIRRHPPRVAHGRRRRQRRVDAVPPGLRRRRAAARMTLSRVASGGVTAVSFGPGALHGLRVELVDPMLRDGFLDLLADPPAIR